MRVVLGFLSAGLSTAFLMAQSNPGPATTGQSEAPAPQVKMYPARPEGAVDPALKPKPFPKSQQALIGGVVREIDPIRYRMTVDVFGGSKLKTAFDPRTQVLRNGEPSDVTKILKGDRVYLDTQNVEGRIFARQIQIQNNAPAADVKGQVVAYLAGTRELRLREPLSAREVTFQLDPKVQITHHGAAAAPESLAAGALVTGEFVPQSRRASLQRLEIVAAPGEIFTFFGDVTYLDLSKGRLALENRTDSKLYEVALAGPQPELRDVGIGSEVSVTARFDGKGYVADHIQVTRATPPAVEEKKDDQPR